MKRTFTKLMAALALLVALAIPMGMWGQTRDVVTTTFKSGQNYSAGMTLPYEAGGLGWVTSAKPTGFESASPSRGIQYSKVSTNITTTIADASITKVELVASTNANANANNISVYVGSTQIGSTQNMPKENNVTYTFESSTGLQGEIKVSMHNDGTKSTYIKSIAVTYTTSGGGGSDTYTVTYNDNDATSGDVPEDTNEYESGDEVTVLGNTGNLAKTHYSFGGWCMNTQCTGTIYGPDPLEPTFNITSNTTLYAKWNPNTYVVTLPNNDQYGNYTMDATNPVAYGTTVNLTYTPNAGYENYAATWKVNGTALEGNSFTMPDAAVTVTVELEQVMNATFVFNTDAGLTALGITKPTTSGTGTDLDPDTDYTSGIVTMNITHGGTNTRVWNNGGTTTELRVYNGNNNNNNVDGTLTFSVPNGVLITGVTFSCASGYVLSDWSSNTGEQSVTFTASAQKRIYTATVAYTSTSALLPPSFNPGAGTYNVNQSVEITCTTNGADIRYTTNGEAPTTSSALYGGAITVDRNMTIKAIAIKDSQTSEPAEAQYVLTPMEPTFTPAAGSYEGTQTVAITCTTEGATLSYKLGDNGAWTTYENPVTVSESTILYAKAHKDNWTDRDASAAYTITQISNISDITEEGDYIVQGTIVAMSNRGFVLGDATGYVYYYLGGNFNPSDYFVGKNVKLSGYVSAQSNYKVFQFGSNTEITSVEESSYEVENPTTLTGAQMDAVVTGTDVTLSKYVQYVGKLSVNNNYYNITDINGATTAQGSISYPINTDFASLNGKQVTVTGYFVGVSSGQYYNTMLGSIEEIVPTEPTLSANPTALDFTYEVGATEVPTKSFTLTGSNLSDDAITISLPENSNFEMQGPSKSYGRILYLTPIEGAINQEITVRLKENLDVNNYEDEITIDWQGDDFSVTLSGAVVGPHVTWDLTIADYDSASEEQVQWTSTNATMTLDRNGATSKANAYLNQGNPVTTRFYNGQKLTFAPNGGCSIAYVEITGSSASYIGGLTGNDWTNASTNVSDNIVTVTPETGTEAFYVTITETVRLTSVTVYYLNAPKHTLAVTTLTNAEIVVFDATDPDDTSWEWLFEGTGDAQVAEGTPIALSVSAEQGYVLTELMVNDVNHVADIEGGLYTFYMPTQNVTITVKAVEAYTIYFFVNGEEFSEMDIPQGNALGTLPTPTENIPEGFTFVGWMESPVHPYYHATDAPTMVDETTGPEDDMMLDAVFCIASSTTIYTLSNNVPVDGDKVILAAKNSDNYYAMYNKGEKQLLSINNDVVTTANPSDYAWNVTEASYGSVSGLALVNNDGIFHMNVSSFNVTSDYNNGIFEFNESIMYGLVNNKYLKFDGSFGVSGDIENACDLYFFKGVSSPNANTDYTTLVTNHADESIIAENAAETLYGIHYINGYVWAVKNVTNSGKLVVNNEGTLDMDGILANSAAANFVIKDGGQYKGNEVLATMEKTIVGYGNVNNKGGWYLLSSPLGTIDAGDANVTNLMSGPANNYDIYGFDQGATDLREWRNYKLIPVGYSKQIKYMGGVLYGNIEDMTATFTGTLSNGGNAITLDYTDGSRLSGFNIVGNPLSSNAYLYGKTKYYRLQENAQGESELVETSHTVAIAPMEAVFVQAEGEEEEVYFSTLQPTSKHKMINLQVMHNRGQLVDRACVAFGEGSVLGKFQLNENNTKIYFTQGNKDYAVVRSNGQGEMPVNFKAETRGTYTLNVEAENVEMNYLHLIDNMTGADVDLLATPSYTFEASNDDYESRFRLVFNANDENGASTESETFAYYNGSEWVISNMGDATLQVVDVMGRVLSSETVSGNATINLNQMPGVYMLRLVNGENVKVQKVVVR